MHYFALNSVLFVCFLGVRNIQNRKTVADGYASVEAALCDYTLTCYSHVDVSISLIRIGFLFGGIFIGF